MSGIAVIARLDGSVVEPGEVQGMLAALRRRGPDGQSAWTQGCAGMGHAALITTEEARRGRQPWVHDTTGCVVVSDSRLDDRAELARTLDIPHDDIDSVCDGRLLFEAWQRWGTHAPFHLRGDFAFAIWDPRSASVFCARDPLGVRPLYFHHAPGRVLVVASEPAAILTLPEIPRELDEGRLADLLVPRLTAIDKTCTFHASITRLAPAHWLSVTAAGLQTAEYWRPYASRPLPKDAPDERWLEGLDARLRQAVARCLRSSVRVGAMLSGGLDSSTVAAIASQQLEASGQGPLPTFSAVSLRPDCPETQAINTMASAFGFDAVRVSTSGPVFDESTKGFLTLREPFEALACLIDCQYIAAARHDVRVVLDGVDGDNLLAHGNYFPRLFARGHWRKLWHEAREQSRFYGEAFKPMDYFRTLLASALVPAFAKPLLRRIRLKARMPSLVANSGMNPAVASRVDLCGRLHRLDQALADGKHDSPDGEASTSICSPLTTEAIERYGRVASARGIEPRHPLLDRDLVEFATWIPARLLHKDGYPKWILRKIMQSRLPREVVWRRGKEHLGPEFNKRLTERLRDRPLALSPDTLAMLDRLLEPAWRPPWPKPIDGNTPGWEDELRLRAMASWMERGRVPSVR